MNWYSLPWFQVEWLGLPNFVWTGFFACCISAVAMDLLMIFADETHKVVKVRWHAYVYGERVFFPLIAGALAAILGTQAPEIFYTNILYVFDAFVVVYIVIVSISLKVALREERVFRRDRRISKLPSERYHTHISLPIIGFTVLWSFVIVAHQFFYCLITDQEFHGPIVAYLLLFAAWSLWAVALRHDGRISHSHQTIWDR